MAHIDHTEAFRHTSLTSTQSAAAGAHAKAVRAWSPRRSLFLWFVTSALLWGGIGAVIDRI